MVYQKSVASMFLFSSQLLFCHTKLFDPNQSFDSKPMALGNFALPMALIPSPLFSLGQNVVDKGDVLTYVNPILLSGKNDKRFFYNEIYTLVGLSNNLSIFILFPVPVINKEAHVRTSGFGDIILQGEYCYYNKADYNSLTQATAIASIYLPSGILESERGGFSQHAPFTGLGAPAYFFGGTWSRTTYDWYTFASGGVLITTRHKGNKIGSSVLYQAGIGKNLGYRNDKILVGMIEFDGITFKKDRLANTIDQNSGGTIMYLGPSLYIATQNTIFQMGFQIPCYQKLNGIQAKNSFLLSISFAWLMRHFGQP